MGGRAYAGAPMSGRAYVCAGVRVRIHGRAGGRGCTRAGGRVCIRIEVPEAFN